MAKSKKNDILISRNRAIRDLKELQTVLAAEGDPFLAGAMNRPIGCLEGQPAVDALEVIRCKECRWYLANLQVCSLHSESKGCVTDGFAVGMEPTGFCSYGERSTNGR